MGNFKLLLNFVGGASVLLNNSWPSHNHDHSALKAVNKESEWSFSAESCKNKKLVCGTVDKLFNGYFGLSVFPTQDSLN